MIYNESMPKVESSMRYEIKLVLDQAKLTELLVWMHRETTAKPVHYPRYVNSLYFDNTEFQAVRDNLIGISDRKKIRLRWYHRKNKEDISEVALELKFREGRLGRKEFLKLPKLRSSLLMERLGNIIPSLVGEMLYEPVAVKVLDDHYVPALHLNYLREYFVDTNDIRITIDSEIKFFPVMPLSKLYDEPYTSYPLFVAEIKFDPAQKRRVAQLMRTLKMTPKRHSKYLIGMASLGQALYI